MTEQKNNSIVGSFMKLREVNSSYNIRDYDYFSNREICKAIINGIDPRIVSEVMIKKDIEGNPSYDSEQLKQIRLGLEEGLVQPGYLRLDGSGRSIYDAEKMRILRKIEKSEIPQDFKDKLYMTNEVSGQITPVYDTKSMERILEEAVEQKEKSEETFQTPDDKNARIAELERNIQELEEKLKEKQAEFEKKERMIDFCNTLINGVIQGVENYFEEDQDELDAFEEPEEQEELTRDDLILDTEQTF